MELKSPQVFISYSHDSDEHETRVVELSDRLCADGVDSNIDAYVSPPEGWPFWMEHQIDQSDFVLIVCTATYRKRVENRDEPTKGAGVLWEINSIYNRLYSQKLVSSKFIPLLFEGASDHDVPVPLAAFTRYFVSSENGYEKLFRFLTNQPFALKPKVNSIRTLPVKQRSQQSLPGALSLEKLSQTPTNPKYAEDIFLLDKTYKRSAVANWETIVIVIGTSMVAELLDRAVAAVLRDYIDSSASGNSFRRAIILTDEGWSLEPSLSDNPVISIGGPPANKLSTEFSEWKDPQSGLSGIYSIPGAGNREGFFRKNAAGRPQVGLWGKTANDTRETVEHYLKNEKGIKDFLRMSWG